MFVRYYLVILGAADLYTRFLHAQFHLNRVIDCTTLGDIYYHLDNFPPDLDSYYDEEWKRATEDETSPVSQRASLILMWLTITDMVFTEDTLQKALSLCGAASDRSRITREEILSSCAGFVSLSKYVSTDSWSSSIVTIVHPSAHRYLNERKELHFPGANDLIVGACLKTSAADEIADILTGYQIILIEYGEAAEDTLFGLIFLANVRAVFPSPPSCSGRMHFTPDSIRWSSGNSSILPQPIG